MEYIDICTIDMNEGEGRQTIRWNPEDHRLYTTAMEEPIDTPECATIEEAEDTAYQRWGRMKDWHIEWIER